MRRARLAMADVMHAWMSEAARAQVAGAAATARLLRGKKPIAPIKRGSTPNEIVAERAGVTLRRFRAERPRAALVVVASLINKYYVMDLLPGISVFERLLRAGFELFVLDWGAPGPDGPDRTFADYVDGFIPWGVEQAAREFGGKPVATMGYCMGGTMAVMHAARHPETVRALVLLGTPVDFQKSGVLATWTQPKHFDGDLLVDAFGNIPPFMLQSAFKGLALADLPRKYLDLVKRADDEDAVRHFVALESWLEDNIAFPGGVYRQYIRDCYQENALYKNQMVVGGSKVDLKKMTMPILNVIALRDHICEPPASRALMTLAGSSDKTAIEFDTGHIGLTTSRRALKDLWPQIESWLAAH